MVLVTGTETRRHFDATPERIQRILEPAHVAQRHPEPVESGAVVRIEFHRALQVPDDGAQVMPLQQPVSRAQSQVGMGSMVSCAAPTVSVGTSIFGRSAERFQLPRVALGVMPNSL